MALSFSLVIALIVVLSLIEQVKSSTSKFIVEPASLKETNYPRWAHYHWVWNHNSYSNQEAVKQLVADYKANKIPFGAVNIDSTWETEYNNFIVNPEKFSDFPGLVKSLHDDGYKVLLWITSMINTENPDFVEAEQKGYLVRNGKGKVAPIKWWHGAGGLLDYSNPKAVDWWHSKLDLVLDAGVDGFKCDGIDPYIMEYTLEGGALGFNDQPIRYHDYRTAYYRDFLNYTRKKRGGDAGLIMSRPVDCMVDPVTKVCWDYSPQDVMFAGWVGDDDSSFNGMRGCMRKVIYSAWENYANFGCDIGGYRPQEGGKNKPLFIRWAQFGAFLPLMENGGGGEHRPWMYDDETLFIYRKFAVEHHRIAPYLHTVGANAIDGKHSSITPLSKKLHEKIPLAPTSSSDSKLTADETGRILDRFPGFYFPEPTTFSYLLGPDLLVHPVTHDYEGKDGNNTVLTELQRVYMEFPEVNGQPTTWLDYWHPHDTHRARKSGTTAHEIIPLETYPVYVRKNAMLPLESRLDSKIVLFTWFSPDSSASTEGSPVISQMRESKSESTGTGMEARAYFTSNNSGLVLTLSSHRGPAGFEVIDLDEPSQINIDSWATSFCEKEYSPKTRTLLVVCKDAMGGVRVTVDYTPLPTI